VVRDMKGVYQKISSFWAKYSEYEYRRDDDGNLFLMPTPTSKVSVYDPLKDADTMVVEALNVGRLAMKRGDEATLKQAVLEFVTKYGLLGFMTALPTTPEFFIYPKIISCARKPCPLKITWRCFSLLTSRISTRTKGRQNGMSAMTGS
jgi:hypothetical protein